VVVSGAKAGEITADEFPAQISWTAY